MSDSESKKRTGNSSVERQICIGKVKCIECVRGNIASVKFKHVSIFPGLQHLQTQDEYDQAKLTRLWSILRKSKHYLTRYAVINLTVCAHKRHTFNQDDVVLFASRITPVPQKQKSKNKKKKKKKKKKYVCDKCDKTYNNPSSWYSHKMTHTDRFKCKVCGRCCQDRTLLANHIQTHTGERPFKCEEPGCNVAFIKHTQLEMHLCKHTGVWPYRCQFCNKGFARLCRRDKHEGSHLNYRPFKCEHCQKGFNWKFSLTKHQKNDTCGMCFPKSSLE